MIRRVAAIIFALTLTPAVLYAQESVLTVTVSSADVYKGPSTVTPVIGHVARGTVLPVSRNLGSWVRVPWTGAPDGAGYVHVTMGRLSPASADTMPSATTPQSPSALAPAPPQSVSAPVPMTAHPRTSAGERVAVATADGLTTISHVVGVGGLVESVHGFGASARAWHRNHLGFDFRMTRSETTNAVDTARLTSVQFEPAVVFAPFDRVTDYVWFRPYVGSGLSVARQTLKAASPAAADGASENGTGWRVFGGSELTFAGATQFGFSAEVGYRKLPVLFPGFEPDRMSLSIAGHWYVK